MQTRLPAHRNQPVTAAKLYDLVNDIGESKDLAAAKPDEVRKLQAQWDKWNATLVKPLWGNGKSDNDGPEPGAPSKKNKLKDGNMP